MGQLIARPTDGIEKTDINVDYQTYGIEGESDYAIDGNGEYGYDYGELEGKSDHTQRNTRLKVWIISLQHVDMIDWTLQHSQKQRSKESAVSLWSFSVLS